MRRSNLARKPRGNIATKPFALKGGLNLVDSPLNIPNGMAIVADNYEVLTRDGYDLMATTAQQIQTIGS